MSKFVIKKLFDFSIAEAFLNNNFSSPTHWPEWNILISKYYNTKFFYFIAYKKNELIGICPVHKTDNGTLKTLHSGQFHFIPNGGWIFSEETEVTEQFYPIPATQMFQGFSLPLIDQFNATYNFKNLKKFQTLIIDLDKDLDNIWKEDLNSKRRNMIRKAEKSGVEVVSYNKSNLQLFYKYYEQANKRNNLQIQPFNFFRELFTANKNIDFDILAAYQNGNILNFVVTVSDKNYSFYWLGITNNHAPNLGQGALLQWEAIQRSKKHGCRYYDLCYIEKEKLPHIYKFKKDFSKTEVPIIFHAKKTIVYTVLNKILRNTKLK